MRAAGAEFIILPASIGAPSTRSNRTTSSVDLGTDLLLASADIDLVLGHHAHVVQPVEQVAGEYLVYGMGNFLSNQSPAAMLAPVPLSTQDGVIMQFTISEGDDGSFAVTDASYVATHVDRSDYTIARGFAGATPSARLEASDGHRPRATARTAAVLTGLSPHRLNSRMTFAVGFTVSPDCDCALGGGILSVSKRFVLE